jgi:hypothetical protein
MGILDKKSVTICSVLINIIIIFAELKKIAKKVDRVDILYFLFLI